MVWVYFKRQKQIACDEGNSSVEVLFWVERTETHQGKNSDWGNRGITLITILREMLSKVQFLQIGIILRYIVEKI